MLDVFIRKSGDLELKKSSKLRKVSVPVVNLQYNATAKRPKKVHFSPIKPDKKITCSTFINPPKKRIATKIKKQGVFCPILNYASRDFRPDC